MRRLTGNLGAPQLAALADERFERLLTMALGNDEARWPLAVGLAALGQRHEAIAELETLRTAAPAVAARYPLADTLAA